VAGLSRVLPVAIGVFIAFGLNAAGQNLQIERWFVADTPDATVAAQHQAWEPFESAFAQSAVNVFADQFHPLQVMSRDIAFNAGGPGVWADHEVSTLGHALSQSFESGLREASLDLPVVSWLSQGPGFLARFVRNTVADEEEEAVDPLELRYRPAEHSWWRRLSSSRALSYGLRPLRTDPYAFLGWGIRNGGEWVLFGHARYYYDHFADHKFELSLSLPLGPHFSMNLGSSYRFGQHEEQKRLALKLLRALPGGNVLHVGLALRLRPALFAGISFPW
jgi:hypothetical protein